MSYCGPYSESYNFTHMFNKGDLRGKLPLSEPTKGTLLDIIYTNPEFSIFKHVVKKSQINKLLNANEADFTMFIPSNKALSHINPNFFTYMDIATARSIVRALTVSKRLSSEVLGYSNASYLYSIDKVNKLFITNIRDITNVSGFNVIQKDILASNGIIHVIDGLPVPTMT